VTHYLVVGAILFTAGIVCMAVKRNALGVLMGIELVLNGANPLGGGRDLAASQVQGFGVFTVLTGLHGHALGQGIRMQSGGKWMAWHGILNR